MILSIIVACGENGVIGVNNSLPWHLPEDLRHFKSLTMGKPLIMGRKTFDSIGRPLPGRVTIVVTRQEDWRREGVIVAGSLEEAIRRAEGCLSESQQEVMIAGGEDIYRQSLPLCQRIYLTKVEIAVDGDAFFPRLLCDDWFQVACDVGTSAAGDLHYSFITLEKA